MKNIKCPYCKKHLYTEKDLEDMFYKVYGEIEDTCPNCNKIVVIKQKKTYKYTAIKGEDP